MVPREWVLPMKRIAVVASQEREFSGVLRRFGAGEKVNSPLRFARRVRNGGFEWLLLADGQGALAAGRACAAISNWRELFAVGSIGYCGGTRPAWKRGDVLMAHEVEDRRSGERFPCWMPDAGHAPPAGRVLTVERVIGAAREKRSFGEEGVDAVEMEAASVARFALEHNVRFFSLKAVSDPCDEDLAIDFNRAMRPDGSTRIASILVQAAAQPWLGIPCLSALARAAALSSENLGVSLAALFPANGDNGKVSHGDS